MRSASAKIVTRDFLGFLRNHVIIREGGCYVVMGFSYGQYCYRSE